MRGVISAVLRHPLQFAAGSLLAAGLVVSAAMSMTTRTSIGSTTASTSAATTASTDAGYGYGYGHEGPGLAKGHRLHCPSEQGQLRSKGHAVCHLAPRHGR
jgi:hypothetical protein